MSHGQWVPDPVGSAARPGSKLVKNTFSVTSIDTVSNVTTPFTRFMLICVIDILLSPSTAFFRSTRRDLEDIESRLAAIATGVVLRTRGTGGHSRPATNFAPAVI